MSEKLKEVTDEEQKKEGQVRVDAVANDIEELENYLAYVKKNHG